MYDCVIKIAARIVCIVVGTVFVYHFEAHALTIEAFDSGANGDVIISPLRWEEAVEPGDVLTREFQIGNRTDNPMIFSLSAEDFVGSSNPQNPIRFLGDAVAPNTSARDWIIPEVSEFRLDPAELARVAVDIRVPRRTSPGGHFAALFATGQVIDDDSNRTKNIQTSTRLGVLLLAEIPGEMRKTAEIESFHANGKTLHTDSTIPFSVLLANTGNTHIKASGTITISNISGKIVDVLVVEDFNVLPGSVREREALLSRPFLFGRYRALLDIAYADSSQQMSIVFWVIPSNVSIAIIIGLLLILFMWYLRRWRSNYPGSS